MKFQTPIQKGFTLIELVLYMGIMVILLTMLASIFGSIVEVQLDSKAHSSADQDSRYIIAKLNYDMQMASSIISPALGSQSATLQLSIDSATQTYALDGSGNLQLTRSGLTDNLNSANTSISNLSFTRLGKGDENDTIQVQFTVTSRVSRIANKTEIKSFTTTIGRQ